MCLSNCRSLFLTAWFFVSVEFVYVYGCLSVWMVVCVCDRLSAYVSGLVSVLSYNRSTLCLYLYVSVWPHVYLRFCLCVCVYVCLISYWSVFVCICVPLSAVDSTAAMQCLS